MKTIIEFFMPMQPPTATHQQKQINWKNRTIYESQETAEARAKLTVNLAAHRPAEPMTGPLTLHVKWCFPVQGKHTDGEYKATKSDLDNLAKQLLDVMTTLGFWKDDAQVACLILEKFWASRPGIFIRVRNLEGEQA